MVTAKTRPANYKHKQQRSLVLQRLFSNQIRLLHDDSILRIKNPCVWWMCQISNISGDLSTGYGNQRIKYEKVKHSSFFTVVPVRAATVGYQWQSYSLT